MHFTIQQKNALQPLIDQLILRAQAELPVQIAENFSHFLQLYYSHIHQDDFENKDPSTKNLYEMAYSHWELLTARKGSAAQVRVFNPDPKSGWEVEHTVIQVVAENTPFLVDSIKVELDRQGIGVHFALHMGGMAVVRDKTGCLLRVQAYEAGRSGQQVEAPLYFEIDRQVDVGKRQELCRNLERILASVKVTVEDWSKMVARVESIIAELDAQAVDDPNHTELVAFLRWLLNDRFLFLGARDYKKIEVDGEPAIHLVRGSGLGILRDETRSTVIRKYTYLPETARKIALSLEHLIIISKTNTQSVVHRRAYTDYIGVKMFNAQGEIIGEHRFLGLYTSAAYSENIEHIPFVRQKVRSILEASQLPAHSHAGKDLLHILSTLPRDDLFQGTAEELYSIVMGILHLQERKKIRLFVREDSYKHYLSCLVYLPREDFNTVVTNRMSEVLRNHFKSTEIDIDIYFTNASILARIHFLVRLSGGAFPEYSVTDLENELSRVGRSWQDVFYTVVLDYFGPDRKNEILGKYKKAFPTSYRESFIAEEAIQDIKLLEDLSESTPLRMSFYRPPGAPSHIIKFKLFHLHSTIPLSDALPMLENMGLRVFSEETYCISMGSVATAWINDFNMTYLREPNFNVKDVSLIFQEAFNYIWLGHAENDIFNRLVLEAQLSWREITIFRAYAKYLKQTGFTYSPEYIAQTLINHAGITHLIKDLFCEKFDPAKFPEQQHNVDIKTNAAFANIAGLIEQLIADVSVLDEDRILSRYVELIKATLRTNYYQYSREATGKPYLSFKFCPAKITQMPLPLPKFEFFVYSPDFEGVHLRCDKVARGGIRLSDRKEDFRIEILGLMKAQNVKNAVIVPSGAKGGFIAKNISSETNRELASSEAVYCYRQFIRSLLELTDNIAGGEVITPAQLVTYDDVDPYLVVAPDKGTASFSDIANEISNELGFWLGDAFASGGSMGYDHKKMGITARGAWISAEQHFRDLGVNVNQAPITVVGIGDMSGDVFGNGMLLSKNLKLVAAFNHLDIFIDPNPDPEVSFKERERLFLLPRSRWTDYNPEYISQGGGVFSRKSKRIILTPEMQKLLHCQIESLLPNDLIREILKLPVDMLWNGGIGTYIKSKQEKHVEVGDRANDAIRINGSELAARVFCEGGNLGATQLGRIEYALAGGRVNTDFIDNSAGVDCSDREVLIKVLFSSLLEGREISIEARNNVLLEMTEDVARLVLRNNYEQNRSISYASFISPKRMNFFIRYLEMQERKGRIDRDLEFLPTQEILLERRNKTEGLTRPELSVLLAYSKIILEKEIRNSDLPEDPYLSNFVQKAFPSLLCVGRYRELLSTHKLHREIISTQLSNTIVSNMGLTFTFQMWDETSESTATIIPCYAIAHAVFSMNLFYQEIESLDYIVTSLTQMQMIQELIQLIRRATRWLLRNYLAYSPCIQKSIEFFGPSVQHLLKNFSELLQGEDKARFERKKQRFIEQKVPSEIAAKVAGLAPSYHFLNIVQAAQDSGTDLNHLAKVYFVLMERMKFLWFIEQINDFIANDRWTILCKAGYKSDLDVIQRELTIGVLRMGESTLSIEDSVALWFESYAYPIKKWMDIIQEMQNNPANYKFEVFSVAIRVLFDLVKINRKDNSL